MFDVGFWELVVILVVALLVLGPKRLPEVASQLGQWTGKARGMARILKQQLREEMGDIDPRRVMDPLPQNRDNPGTTSNRSEARPAETTSTAAAPPPDPPAG